MKALGFLRALPLALMLMAPVARAEQSTIVLPTSGPKTAAELMTAANAALLSIQSCNSGTSAPANGPSSVAKAYQCWADTSAAPSIAIKQYDGTQWVTVGVLNTSAHTWTPFRQGSPIAAVATSSSAADLTTGTLPAARLPTPTASTLGGVMSKAAVASNFLTSIGTDGSIGQAQPVKADFGLGNVDNTSDLNKPVSTAQAAADALKVNLTRSIATGCGLAGGGDLSSDRTLRLNITLNPQSGSTYSVVDGDCGKIIRFNNAGSIAVTLPAPSGGNFADGWSVDFQNIGAGTATITPTATTINNGSSIALSQNQGMHCNSNGSAYTCVLGVGAGAGAGTVTSVACGNGLSCSTITASGTIAVESFTPGGRLTIAPNTPVPAASQTAMTAISYAPYKSRFTPIFTSGIGMRLLPFTVSATDTAGQSITLGSAWVLNSNYDVFAYVNGSVAGICTGPDWSAGAVSGSNTVGASSRGTGAGSTDLQLYNGILTNANSLTCRTANATTVAVAANEGTYLGTFRTSAAGTVSFTFGASGVAGTFNVWNAYNQELFCSTGSDSTSNWTYNSATIRQANASPVNQFNFVAGLAQGNIEATYNVSARTAAAGAIVRTGTALNSTSTITHGAMSFGTGTTNYTVMNPATGSYVGTLGANYISANEGGDGANSMTFIAFSVIRTQQLKACMYM